MESGEGTVCVTGGDRDGSRYISFLTNIPEKLRIFAADLGDPQSFSLAIEGCVGVFHVATPVDFEDRDQSLLSPRDPSTERWAS
ncbi:Epimerase domain-containing protein [Psidium guajava]|nr:Epimerase domain-containing protein [Psidium guajava]